MIYSSEMMEYSNKIISFHAIRGDEWQSFRIEILHPLPVNAAIGCLAASRARALLSMEGSLFRA
jgi:hypothetical protein